MLDKSLIAVVHRPLQQIALQLITWGIRADLVTVVGFVVGLTALPLIITHHYYWALLSIFLNRLADGLDGSIARLTTPTHRGAFLDSVFDFLFYSSIPLAFAFADPPQNALAAALLIYSFIGTGCSFLAFAFFMSSVKFFICWFDVLVIIISLTKKSVIPVAKYNGFLSKMQKYQLLRQTPSVIAFNLYKDFKPKHLLSQAFLK